jgi:hypothetical protein
MRQATSNRVAEPAVEGALSARPVPEGDFPGTSVEWFMAFRLGGGGRGFIPGKSAGRVIPLGRLVVGWPGLTDEAGRMGSRQTERRRFRSWAPDLAATT